MITKKYIIGVDEVGRGPIAGPLVVCACAVREGVDLLALFPKAILKDSKKLTERQRATIREALYQYVTSGDVIFGIGEVSAPLIDSLGLSASIQKAIQQALNKVVACGVSKESMVYLDGSLRADETYSNQETIIKGDEKKIEIALASIIAKQYRDALMKKLALAFPEYSFDKHVGYGTKAHYEALSMHGMTKEHRRSFLKKLLHSNSVKS